MSSPCTRRPLAGCRRRAASCHSSLSPSRLCGPLRIALGLACLLAFTLPGNAARPGADGSLNVISSRAATRISATRDTTTARGKELLLSKMERQSNRGKRPKPTEPVPTEPVPTEPVPTEPAPTEPEPTEPTPTEPGPTPTEPTPTEPEPTEPPPAETQPERSPITHGLEVGPATVGLAGAGVTYSKLTLVSGGKASTLVNGTDPETGRPMLSLLDIAGQLTIDVPCVIDRCRVTQVGGLYGVRNSPMVDFEARDSEFEALPGPDGKVAECVVLNARTMRRCIVSGGRDGLKLAGIGGCLIEDTWIYGQISGDGSHCDGIQSLKGEGDWDTWVIRRCRIEGPWQRQTSALIMQADTGNLSGVTIRDCFLSGGTYTLYTRAKPGYVISKVRVVGNVWAGDSWKYGPHSNDCQDLDFSGNWIAPATNSASPVAVSVQSATQLTR